MASHVYPLCRHVLLQQLKDNVATSSVGFYVIGVSSSYVYDATDINIGDIAGGAIVVPETALVDAGLTSPGILHADNMTITGLTPPIALDALIIYAKWDGGNMLLAYIDQTSNSSLPQTIESNELQIIWDGNGIFKL